MDFEAFLRNEDSRYIWHPCTQMKDMEKFPILPIARGSGVYLYDFGGRRYIDCISSWWVNLFGHCHPYINECVKAQLERLEHIIFAGYTHEGAVNLARRLVNLLPRGLDKVFYADNGSSAVEIALKMSYHLGLLRGGFKNGDLSVGGGKSGGAESWRGGGLKGGGESSCHGGGKSGESSKCVFLSLENSYHGETLGALSVGGVGLYKETYRDILIRNIQTPLPKDSSVEALNAALEALDSLLLAHKNEICAFIIEPLVQCAGGMRMHDKSFVKAACERVRAAGIFVIFDEIATGFGRTGEMFALTECDFVPDFLCLSKGISGGYLALSAVVLSDETYNAFYSDSRDVSRSFLHSHSYNGNPLAIAAANATLDIFERENVVEKNRAKSDEIFAEFAALAELPEVSNLRKKGMIFAFDLELKPDKKRDKIALRFAQLALKEGLIIRPLGNVVYFMPPYIITKDEARFAAEGIRRVVEGLTR